MTCSRGRLVRPIRVALWIVLSAGLLLASGTARAEPVRLLVAVGHRYGLIAERPLKFADTDASRVRDVMVSIGGVRPEHATVLDEPSPAQLFAALDKMRADSLAHKADEVTVLFYFSGHGDREALHLGDQRVVIGDLAARLERIPAALRIVVTDACRATREKGMTAEPAFPISLGQLPQATGSVWLNAASDGESAQESDELQGAIFTHSWLSGLRGAADANGDSRVTLDEAFSFAHSQTLLRSAKSSGVLQKPEAVVSLTETAPVVLTQTAARVAVLSLPSSRDTHYLVYASGAKSVFASIWGSGERRTALSVPPGRYVVHRRVGGTGALAQIAIGRGEERQLEASDFTASTLEVLARKGGDVDDDVAPSADRSATSSAPTIARHEVSVGYEVGSSSRQPFFQGPRATYAHVMGASGAWTWAFAAGGGLEMSKLDTGRESEKMLTPYGRVAFEPRWSIGIATLAAGAGVRAGAVLQTLRRADSATIERGGYSGSTTNTAFVWGPEARLGARLATRASPAAWGAFLDVDAIASLALFDEAHRTRAVPGMAVSASLGTRF